MEETKVKSCNKCKRELPVDSDHFYKKCNEKDGFSGICKECSGGRFTNKLTHIPKEGYIFCKKCDRELPHTYQYFPEDKSTKTGLRFVCRECNSKYKNFLDEKFKPSKKWTKEEDSLLIENYKNFSGKELVKKFFPNRTVRALESRANVLQISEKTEETKERTRKESAKIISEKLKGKEKTEEAIRKSSVSIRKYYETHDGYWKGKQKSEKFKIMVGNRVRAAALWKGNNNPRHKNPLCGKENGRWKGGINEVYHELRSDTKNWQQESIEFCKYKCIITGMRYENIHHNVAFKDIVDETFKNISIDVRKNVFEYNEYEFEAIRKELMRLHKCYGHGACLTKQIHKLFHDTYGYTNIGVKDLLDFIYKIDCGDFDYFFENSGIPIMINYEYVNYLESIMFETT